MLELGDFIMRAVGYRRIGQFGNNGFKVIVKNDLEFRPDPVLR